jgi:serine/threonine-protein kinase
MESLQGEPLDQRLERFGRLSAQDTALILQQVCRALAKAHQVGIVHRDLKPENVFLVWDDDDQADIAKVVDFGIAKFTDASLGVSSATRTGSVLGTPYFMSPEQARGLRSVDYRSDLWAVGVIAYRCIVGKLPFEGEAVGDLLVKICTAPLPVPTQAADGIPPGFDTWFTRALARNPAERFSSAAELANELSAAVGMAVRGEMSSAMMQQIPVPAAGYAPAGTPQTGAQPAYHTPSTGAHPMYHTPSSGSHEAYTTPFGNEPTAHSPNGATAAPFTHTADSSSRSTPIGAILAIAAVALVVIGIGVAAALKFVSGGEEATPAAGGPETEPSAAAAMVDEPSVAPVPAPPEPAVEPSAEAPDTAVAKQEEKAASKPQSRPRPSPARVQRPAPRTAPRPAAAPAPAPRPAPAPKPRPKQVDIGY